MLNKSASDHFIFINIIGFSIALYLFYVLFTIDLDCINRVGIIIQMIAYTTICISLWSRNEELLRLIHYIVGFFKFISTIIASNPYLLGFLLNMNVIIRLGWILNDGRYIQGTHIIFETETDVTQNNNKTSIEKLIELEILLSIIYLSFQLGRHFMKKN